MTNVIPFPRLATVGGMPALILGPESWHFTRVRVRGPHGWSEYVVPNGAIDKRMDAHERACTPCDTQPDGAA